MPGSMRGISHLFNSTRTGRSRKSKHKKRGDGFAAPRNSLELFSEAADRTQVVEENILVKHRLSKVINDQNVTSTSKFVDEETPRQTFEIHNAPNVVARLMGMESLPSETSARVHAKEHEVEILRRSTERDKPVDNNRKPNVITNSTSVTSSTRSNTDLPLAGKHKSKNQRSGKQQSRKHPQEEILQKFKKDFEAWQTAKLLDYQGDKKSYTLGDGKNYQTLAQEKLNKEKMERYTDTRRTLVEKKYIENKEVISSPKVSLDLREQDDTQCRLSLAELACVTSSSAQNTKKDANANGSQQISLLKIDKKLERVCSATRIVILKPSFEKNNRQEPLVEMPEGFGKDCNMEDFLQEVKERLKVEMFRKTENNAEGRGSKTSSMFDQRSTDPKQIAHDIAKQIRDNVTRDIDSALRVSELNKTNAQEVQSTGLNSPDLIRRDSRKLLSARMKNAMRNEILAEKHLDDNESSGDFTLINDNIIPKTENMDKNDEQKSDIESVRRSEQETIPMLNEELVSSPSPFRTFSISVSRNFSMKLPSDEQNIAGEQLRRKHEASERFPEIIRKHRKDGSRGVSYMKHNFIFKTKLFGKKTDTKDDTASSLSPVKAVPYAPSAISIPSISQDNSTEVPPSPVSLSSSSHEELCRPDNPSPVSPLEVPPINLHFGESSCNSPEPSLSEQFEQVEPQVELENNQIKHELDNAESSDASYLRDILVTAGFYENRLSDQLNSRWDALTKPISNQVFEEVEAYTKYGNMDTEESLVDDNVDTILGNKLLFDLVNEALQSVLGPKINCSMFRRWMLGLDAAPKGSLLDDLWNQIQSYLNPSIDEPNNIDLIVTREISLVILPSILYDDIDIVSRQIERAVLRDLISEFAHELYC